MDTIQITLAIAAATFAAAVTFAKANAAPADDFSGSPPLLAGEPSTQEHSLFNGRILASPGLSLEARD